MYNKQVLVNLMLRDMQAATVVEEEDYNMLMDVVIQVMKRTHMVKEYVVKDIHTEQYGMYGERQESWFRWSCYGS